MRGLRSGRVLLALITVLASACTSSSTASTRSPSTAAAARSLADVACSLPEEWLTRMWRGYDPARSGDVQILAEEPNLIDPGLPHVGPWDTVQRVPVLWYGPGQVAAGGTVERPVTLAGIAPTSAALLGFHMPRTDEGPMTEALLPNSTPPRLLITVVMDSAGMDVLERWPDAWPYLAGLRSQGAWYNNATVGSTPSQTAQVHATMGTGVFPDKHGLIAHRFRVNGEITTPWAQGPAYLERPTLADLWDAANDNRPVVGIVGTLGIHMGLIGHGAAWPGGDRDLAVLREAPKATTLGAEATRWNLPKELRRDFSFAAYANGVPGFADDVEAVDRADGQLDGKWRSNDIGQLLGGFDTPARTPYETRVIERVIEREGFGADGAPDLLFVNYKLMDYVGHSFSMDSREMEDALKAQDLAIHELVDFLNAHVGEGGWAMVLTADHGSTPPPSRSGAFVISSAKVRAALAERFDSDEDAVPLVEMVQDSQIFLDPDEMARNGVTQEEVARYVMSLTQRQTALAGEDVPEPGARVFRAAFPSVLFPDLPCLKETD